MNDEHRTIVACRRCGHAACVALGETTTCSECEEVIHGVNQKCAVLFATRATATAKELHKEINAELYAQWGLTC